MPIDTSIYGLMRQPVAPPDPVEQYGRALSLKTMMGQQELQGIQTRQALKGEQRDDELRTTLQESGNDPAKIRTALIKTGDIAKLISFDKGQLENLKTKGELDAQQIKRVYDQLQGFGGILAPLAANPNVTHDEIYAAGTRAEQLGLVPPNWKAAIPTDPARLPEYIRGIALSTTAGREAIKAVMPELDWQDTGGQRVPVQKNPLAPGFGGAAPGVAPIAKVQSPDSAASIEAAATQGTLNRGVQIRNANMADARSREANTTASGVQTTNIEGKIRDDYNSASKAFVSVRDAHQRVLSSGQDPSAAGDLALIFNYMKVLDPGSTVREGEFATAQNSGSIPERIKSQYNKAIAGERLSDTIRKDFVDRSSRLYADAEKNQEKIERQYSDIAVRSRANPQNVVSPQRITPNAPKPPPPTQQEIDAELRRRGVIPG